MSHHHTHMSHHHSEHRTSRRSTADAKKTTAPRRQPLAVLHRNRTSEHTLGQSSTFPPQKTHSILDAGKRCRSFTRTQPRFGPSSMTTGPLLHKNLKRNPTPGARMRILTAILTPQYGTPWLAWHDTACERVGIHGTGNPNTHAHL